MSLNKFSNATLNENKKWCEIKCNDLYIGGEKNLGLKSFNFINQGITITVETLQQNIYPVLSNFDGNAKFKFTIDFITSNTPHNNCSISFPVPSSYIINGINYNNYNCRATGYISEYPINTGMNHGWISNGVFNNDNTISCIVHYANIVNTQIIMRAYVEIDLYPK